MAGDKVNNYSQVDSNILELQLTTDKTFKGYHQLTLTNYDNTTVPAIAAGSAIECNGALYKFDTEEAISTTDPVTSATVADGTVYVCIVPGATTCTAAFTATAPTWSDSKQGWYGTGGQANYRYAEYFVTKEDSNYGKGFWDKLKTRLALLKDSNQIITSTTATLVTFDTAEIDVKSEYNVSTNIFTAKNSGYYLITGVININNVSSDQVVLDLYKNGSKYGGHAIGIIVSIEDAPINVLISLKSGDTISLYCFSVSDTNYGVSQTSRLNIIEL
jgi:hypothetical protein